MGENGEIETVAVCFCWWTSFCPKLVSKVHVLSISNMGQNTTMFFLFWPLQGEVPGQRWGALFVNCRQNN